jgi:methylase of polypeptide subunit release factors
LRFHIEAMISPHWFAPIAALMTFGTPIFVPPTKVWAVEPSCPDVLRVRPLFGTKEVTQASELKPAGVTPKTVEAGLFGRALNLVLAERIHLGPSVFAVRVPVSPRIHAFTQALYPDDRFNEAAAVFDAEGFLGLAVGGPERPSFRFLEAAPGLRDRINVSGQGREMTALGHILNPKGAYELEGPSPWNHLPVPGAAEDFQNLALITRGSGRYRYENDVKTWTASYTYHVLDRAFTHLRRYEDPAKIALKVLVLGGGLGVEAIALAKQFPRLQITATDVSDEALSVARLNARLHNVHERIKFVKSDVFARVNGRFDFILFTAPRAIHRSRIFSQFPTGRAEDIWSTVVGDLSRFDPEGEILHRLFRGLDSHLTGRGLLLLMTNENLTVPPPEGFTSRTLVVAPWTLTPDTSEGNFAVHEIRRQSTRLAISASIKDRLTLSGHAQDLNPQKIVDALGVKFGRTWNQQSQKLDRFLRQLVVIENLDHGRLPEFVGALRSGTTIVRSFTLLSKFPERALLYTVVSKTGHDPEVVKFFEAFPGASSVLKTTIDAPIQAALVRAQVLPPHFDETMSSWVETPVPLPPGNDSPDRSWYSMSLLGTHYSGGNVYIAPVGYPKSRYGFSVLSAFFQHLVRHDSDGLSSKRHVLVLGGGTGYEAIAIARQYPSFSVVSTDINEQALALGRLNAQLHGAANRVEFVQSDLFASLSKPSRRQSAQRKFDYILFNAPAAIYPRNIRAGRLQTREERWHDLLKHSDPPFVDIGGRILSQTLREFRSYLAPRGSLFLMTSETLHHPSYPELHFDERILFPWSDNDPNRFAVYRVTDAEPKNELRSPQHR